MMTTTPKPQTQPRLQALPQSSPSPEGNHIVDMTSENAKLVAEVLARRGVPDNIAGELSTDLLQALGKAAAKVPAWVVYVAISFLGPAFAAFYGTYQAVSALPPRVDALEKVQAEQGKQLDRIEALLQAPTSRPTR